MKLHPYKEILKMTKEAVDKSLIPVREHRAKKQAELEIAKLEERIATQEAKVHELCTVKEINFNAIIEAQDELALLERRIKQFEKVVEEMFP